MTELLTRASAAVYLRSRGIRYTPKTLANKVYNDASFPKAIRIGHLVYYKRAELDAWINSKISQKDVGSHEDKLPMAAAGERQQ